MRNIQISLIRFTCCFFWWPIIWASCTRNGRYGHGTFSRSSCTVSIGIMGGGFINKGKGIWIRTSEWPTSSCWPSARRFISKTSLCRSISRSRPTYRREGNKGIGWTRGSPSVTSIVIRYKARGIPSSSKAGTRLDRKPAPEAETRKARVIFSIGSTPSSSS